MDAVSKMFEGLDKARSGISALPAKAYARNTYLDAIADQSGMTPTEPRISGLPQGALGSFAGMPVYSTENLPKGVLCMFLDKDNKPLGQIVDDTYAQPTPDPA